MVYDESWDRIHAPGPEDDWQESDCYWFYDLKAGIGGFHRVGQKPNRQTGQLTLFAFAKHGERHTLNEYNRTEFPITTEDRWESGHRVKGHSAHALGGGRMRYTWEEQESSADLEFYEQFYTPRGWSKSHHEQEFMKTMNAGGHLEVGGRIRGTITIGAERYEIDALAHRDRSWGFRDNTLVSWHRFRMFSGTVGPEFSIASFIADLRQGDRMLRTVSGFVVRDGKEEDVRDLRVSLTFDSDGVSVLSGTAIVDLESGETIRIPITAQQAFMTHLTPADDSVVDTISIIEYGGVTGFCDLTHWTNPGRGGYKPSQEDLTLTAVDRGLSKSVVHEF